MLTQPPQPLALARTEAVDHSDLPAKSVKKRLLRRLRSLMNTAQSELVEAQARYKRIFSLASIPLRNSITSVILYSYGVKPLQLGNRTINYDPLLQDYTLSSASFLKHDAPSSSYLAGRKARYRTTV